MSERAQEPQTWLINIGGYGEFEFIGTEEEAEAMRRHKSAWEGGVGTKKLKPADPIADSIDVEKERLGFEAYIASALPSPEFNLQRKNNSSPDFVVDYARPCIDSQWCGWLAAKRAVMSTVISNGKIISHDEALQLAYIKQNESNLARCYLNACIQTENYRVVLEKIVNFSDSDMGDGDGARAVAKEALCAPELPKVRQDWLATQDSTL